MGHTNRAMLDRLLRLTHPGYRHRWEIFDGIVGRLSGEGSRWLDGGCGRNIAITEFPCDITVGIDVYRHPELMHAPPTHFVMGSLDAMPFPDGSFTLCTLNTVVEHLSDPARVFAEIHRVLAPNGHLLIHTTNAKSPIIMFGNLLPERLRLALMKAAFGAHEPDVFTAYHRCNTASRLGSISGFDTVRIHPVQDLNWTSAPVMLLLLAWDLVTRIPGLWRLRSNLVVLLRKGDAS